MVVINANFVVLECQILHTKFQSSGHYGSADDFEAFYHINGQGGHLGHLTWTKSIIFLFLFA